MGDLFVQRPPGGAVTALLSKPVQAKLDTEDWTFKGELTPNLATHTANMPVFFIRNRNKRSDFMDQRHPAIKAVVNVAHPDLENVSPDPLEKDSKANIDEANFLRFLGVTRDGLLDGKAAMNHPDAAGRFTVDTAGVVTILQPKETLKNIPLGADVYWTDRRFGIGSGTSLGTSYVQSFIFTHVPKHVFDGTPRKFTNGRKIQLPFGRLVEKRTENSCEARVLLYSNNTQMYNTGDYNNDIFHPGSGTSSIANTTSTTREKESETQQILPVDNQATTGRAMASQASTAIDYVEGDATAALPTPPRKRQKKNSKARRTDDDVV